MKQFTEEKSQQSSRNGCLLYERPVCLRVVRAHDSRNALVVRASLCSDGARINWAVRRHGLPKNVSRQLREGRPRVADRGFEVELRMFGTGVGSMDDLNGKLVVRTLSPARSEE